MRLLTFRIDGRRTLGALRPDANDEVVERAGFAGMPEFIDAGEEGLTAARS